MQRWKHSTRIVFTVCYQPTNSVCTICGSSGLLVGENDLISFNTSQHLCHYVFTH